MGGYLTGCRFMCIRGSVVIEGGYLSGCIRDGVVIEGGCMLMYIQEWWSNAQGAMVTR